MDAFRMDAFCGIPPSVDLSSKEEEKKGKRNNGFEGASTGQADSLSSMPPPPQLLLLPVTIPIETPQQPLANSVIYSQLMNSWIQNMLQVSMAAAQSPSATEQAFSSFQTETLRNDTIGNSTNIGEMTLLDKGTNGGGMAFSTGISPKTKEKSEVLPLVIGTSSPPKRNPRKNVKKAKKECAVCAKMSFYNYYGVKCCENCKHFFRRTIIWQTKFFCARSGKCEIEGGVEKCRRCRIDKCLLVGMDPNRICVLQRSENREQILAQIEHRRTQMVKKFAQLAKEHDRHLDGDKLMNAEE